MEIIASDILNYENIEVAWENVSYSVIKVSLWKKSPPTTILENVSGMAKPGRLLAILGPSGSGKSTLLNFLTGRIRTDSAHLAEGRVLFNGSLSRPDKQSRSISYVAQEDVMFDFDTPREALYFSARIRTGMTHKKAQESVGAIIDQLSLRKCADTVMGNPELQRGISGGERKRTNIGIELITNPRVMLLDEPTTGLDSSSALKIVTLLKSLATEQSKTIICTIHQPSSEIFEKFDDILLLANGRCCFHGTKQDAVDHFNGLGYPLPSHHNPAEHFLKILHQEQGLASHFHPTRVYKTISEAEKCCHRRRSIAPLWLQAWLLTLRSFRNMIRSPIAFYARSFQTVFFILLLGLLYLNLGRDQASIQDRAGLLFFCIINQSMVALMNGVLVFPPERAVFLREQSSGAYNPFVYATSKIFAEMPLQVLFPAVFASFVYWMTNLTRQLSSFGKFVGICVLVANTAQSYGLFVSAAMETVEAAMAIVPLTVLPFFLTGGLFANSERLNPWFSWLNYISFVRRGFIALMQNEFTIDKRFSCPGNGLPCLFPDGVSVLEYYGFRNERMAMQIFVLVVSMVLLRVLTVLSLAYRAGKQFKSSN